MAKPRDKRLVINFVTSNANKLVEVKAMLEPDFKIVGHPLELVELQGTSEEIVMDKCIRAAKMIRGPVLVEDTSLCFNALNGMPGPYVKHFMESIGAEGLFKLLAAYDDNSAKAICTFAYTRGPGNVYRVFQGTVEGKIVHPRGPMNFGWDPIFEYEGKTFAEMDCARKYDVSHRARALQKLQTFFKEENEAKRFAEERDVLEDMCIGELFSDMDIHR